METDQQRTYITNPDDSSKLAREAIPPLGQPTPVIPGPASDATGGPLQDKQDRGKFYGMPLARRGLRILGATVGIAAVWFVCAWIRHGTMPLGLWQSRTLLSVGDPPARILPPDWLLVLLGLLFLISIAMLALGTQDATPHLRWEKHTETDPSHKE